VLLGETGWDTLLGGNGRDLLLGGMGTDRLDGETGDDILIGGVTDFDASQRALAAIMAEWTWNNSWNAAYATRTSHLRGIGSGRNGSFLLSRATVHEDNGTDTLVGGADADWFFAGYGRSGRDQISDRHPLGTHLIELITDLW